MTYAERKREQDFRVRHGIRRDYGLQFYIVLMLLFLAPIVVSDYVNARKLEASAVAEWRAQQ